MTAEFIKAQREIIQENQLQEKIINEEFKIWKKTVPLLYDLIHSFVLNNPSSVFQWLPNYTSNKQSITVKFLVSTKELDNNYLKLGSIDLPSTLVTSSELTIPTIEDTSNLTILNKWKSNDINKLKISPDGKLAIAFNTNGIIQSYNLTNNDVFDYKYHKLPGFGIDWINSTSFLSGAKDGQIALWNIDKPSTPIQLFKSHNGAINGLSVVSNEQLFASVSDDSTTQFHDIRSLEGNPVITIENSHIQNSIKFHPKIDTLYATGGKDNTVNLYDIRKPNIQFRKLYGHNDTITDLKWDIHNPLQLISTSYDKRVIIWNLNKLDEEFDIDNKKKSRVDPVLKFIHGGHTQRVNDFDVHPNIPNLIGSVGDDNLLEIWKPKTIVEPEEEVEEEHEEHEEEEHESKEEETKEETIEETKEDSKEETKEDVEMKD